MTNRIAIWIGVFVTVAFVIDVIFYGTEHLLFLGKQMFDLLEWMAFWR